MRCCSLTGSLEVFPLEVDIVGPAARSGGDTRGLAGGSWGSFLLGLRTPVAWLPNGRA